MQKGSISVSACVCSYDKSVKKCVQKKKKIVHQSRRKSRKEVRQ